MLSFTTFGGKITADPFQGAPSPAESKPDDDAPESFAMAEETVLTEKSRTLGSPILPCQTPWVELQLFDADGEPVQGAPYSISGGGVSQSGRLDKDGFVRLEGVDLNAEQVMLAVEVEEDDNGELSYTLEVVPLEPEGTGEEDSAEVVFEDVPSIAFDTDWAGI
jgi:hypothetical protein